MTKSAKMRRRFAKVGGICYAVGMKKTMLSIFLLAALLAALLSGCRESEPEPTPVLPTPTPDPYEGMVQVLDGNGGLMWIEESEILEPFAMEREAFVVGDDFAHYNAEGWTLRRGIDVSSHQGDIDWPTLAQTGVEFVIIRCAWRGYGEGNLYEDDKFRQNIEGALAAGLDVGVYVFSQAVDILEAAEEAVFVRKLIKDYEITMPVFFDWERIGTEPARTDNVGGETITACALEFCRLIESAGYTAGVYTNIHLAYNYLDLDALDGLPIWFAGPTDYPQYYYEHDFWQYSFSGSLAGIEGDVDLNVQYIPEAAVG